MPAQLEQPLNASSWPDNFYNLFESNNFKVNFKM